MSEVPLSNGDWLEWLEDNESFFREMLRTATEARRKWSQRLLPLPHGLPEIGRLEPKAPAHVVTGWSKTLMQQRAGFYHLRWGGQGEGRIVVFSCRCLVHCMGLVLEQVSDKVFCVDSALDFCNALKPLHSIPELSLVPGDCSVYRVKFAHENDDDHQRLFFRVQEAHLVQFVAKEKRQRNAVEKVDSGTEGSSMESNVSEEQVEGFELGSSDADSIASSVESEAGDVLEEDDGAEVLETEESSEDEKATLPRAAPGTHVVERTAYYTVINDPKYSDIKVKVHDRWCTPENCGAGAKSKTIVLSHYGEDSESCTKCILVLRSWALMRLQQNNFLEQKSARRKWLAGETERLRKDILALGVTSGGTGHKLADERVREWTPEVLA